MTPDDYITPEQVCELIPGLTPGTLAQRRYLGKEPQFYKPSPKTVLYKRSEILEWIESSAQTRTGQVA